MTVKKIKSQKSEDVGKKVVEVERKKSDQKSDGKMQKAEQKKETVKKEKAKEKPKKERAARKVILDKTVDPFETINFVLMTEKCVRMIESQNKLVFVVRRQSDKKQIRKAVENAFQSPVGNVTTMIDQKGRKRAFVKFSQAGAAGDIAVRLGII